jgi:hypothetical protein
LAEQHVAVVLEFSARGAMPLSEVTNATTAAGSATLWSATMDWPPLGYIANVRTTGAQNMTDNIELPSACVTAKRIERRSPITAFSAADAVVSVEP